MKKPIPFRGKKSEFVDLGLWVWSNEPHLWTSMTKKNEFFPFTSRWVATFEILTRQADKSRYSKRGLKPWKVNSHKKLVPWSIFYFDQQSNQFWPHGWNSITWFLHFTLIQNARLRLEIGFDIWLVETGQLCLIFISKGQFLLKKFIQGHKDQKGQWRPKKVIKGQNFQKSLISSIINVKASIRGIWY